MCDADRVRIAQALFAEYYLDKDSSEQMRTIISTKTDGDRSRRQTQTCLDPKSCQHTQNSVCYFQKKLALELGLLDYDDLLWQQQEVTEGKVPVVEVEFEVKGQSIKTASAGNSASRPIKV